MASPSACTAAQITSSRSPKNGFTATNYHSSSNTNGIVRRFYLATCIEAGRGVVPLVILPAGRGRSTLGRSSAKWSRKVPLWEASDASISRRVNPHKRGGVQRSRAAILRGSLRVVSEARRARRVHEHGVFARFRYNDLKEAARDLRRTRALCKFNGGKERRRTAPRLCCRARHVTV